VRKLHRCERERCDCGGDDDRRRKSSGGGKIAAAMMFRWRFNGEFDSGGEVVFMTEMRMKVNSGEDDSVVVVTVNGDVDG
jgi:phage repressor protein C with HTH and peptisase S24 domain